MKLGALGPVLLVFTFIVGLWTAPIRFTPVGSGSGALTGGHNECRISNYSSDYFEMLSRWSCSFDTESQAIDYFELAARSNAIILQTNSYVLGRIDDLGGDHLYYLTRRDGRFVTNLTSHSLKHIVEYERQFLPGIGH